MPRVLVCDDDGAARATIVRMISSQPDFEIVAETDTGEEAVVLAAALRPDVVVIDQHLPGMSGLDAARAMVAAGLAAPIILVSADDRVATLAADVPGTHFVSKGATSPAGLLSTIRSAATRE